MQRLIIILLLLLSSVYAVAQKVTSDKLISLAESFMDKGQYYDALVPLNECIEKFPIFSDAYLMRSQVKERLAKPVEALTDLNIAVELNPESSEILMNRAVLAYALKRFDLAKPDFRRLLSFRGAETNMVYFRQSNNEGVDNIMTTQSRIHDQLYNYLGLIDYETGLLSSATTCFDSAIQLNPKQPDYYVHRGLTKLKQGETTMAVQNFYSALRLDPEHALAKSNLASMKRKEGKTEEAEQLLREAKLANAKSQHHHAGLGLLLLESGRYAEAILNFDTAILIEPKDGELFISRGLAKEKHNDLTGAMADYSKAIEIDDRWPKAWFVQGNIFLKSNQWTEAIENYSMAILLDENYGLAYHNRAVAYMRSGDKKKACADILKAEKEMDIDSKIKATMCGL